MRKIATIFLALLCFSPTWAKQLTQEEAWKVARSFFQPVRKSTVGRRNSPSRPI